MKSVLISIRPKWCEKIASGDKTIEVRKTRPKLDTPVKCYIYCTQSGVALGAWGKHGKVIGEFTCDRIDKIIPSDEPYGIYDIGDDYVRQTCLENGALWDYGRGAALHGWHISGLKIYDKPRELDWLRKPLECHRGNDRENCVGCWDCEIKRPPQSWCYVAEG